MCACVPTRLSAAVALLLLIAQSQSQNGTAIAAGVADKFNFGQRAREGFIQVGPSTLYDSAHGYGFMQPSNLQQDQTSICADAPFFFSVDVPEGNYDVTLRLGDHRKETSIAVKAEARRLLIEPLKIRRGKFVTWHSTINVRYKELTNGKIVHLKKDEENDLEWDHRLTLE